MIINSNFFCLYIVINFIQLNYTIRHHTYYSHSSIIPHSLKSFLDELIGYAIVQMCYYDFVDLEFLLMSLPVMGTLLQHSLK